MKLARFLPTLPVVISFLASVASAQDIKLRQEALTLLEHASAVSVPLSRGLFEQTVTFRAYSPGGGTREGKYTRLYGAANVYRDEMEYGDYHYVYVFNHGHVAKIKTLEVSPFVARKVMDLVPIYLVRFDHADVIHSINDEELNGRATRCIAFESTYGEKTDQNEICVDKQLGTMVHVNLGDQTVNNYDFFQYRGAYYPGRIEYEKNDLKIEMEQTVKEIQGPLDPSALAPPAGAVVGTVCQEYRRPFGQFMPQPKPGNGSRAVDIRLHGVVRTDGKIHDATIDSSDWPDLNEEALSIIKTWRFNPAMCDGKPADGPVDIVLHFASR
jgi:TonB family protein